MACAPLGNEALWRQILQTSAELRACVQLIVDAIFIEIPEAEVEFSVDLSQQLQSQIDGLEAQLQANLAQIECLNAIVASLTGISAPEVVAFAAAMADRAAALAALNVEISTQLAPDQLPAQVTALANVQNELKCQRANAVFLNNILQSL